MPPSHELDLPFHFALDGRVLGNPNRQAARTFAQETCEIGEGRVGSVPGLILTRPDGTLACMVVGKRVTDHRNELRRKAAAKTGTPYVTRFERGDANTVQGILRKLPHLMPEFRIFVVQPGLSRQREIVSQLELLAVTEAYLQETFGIPMTVYASP